ncbi:MAG: TIGR00730 family Rossman fold protein [Alphaproteobacteria bacterium]|nr:MAG: TIGR00730 family Rossman fold protein [Alphaproteobacteria bacterium]
MSQRNDDPPGCGRLCPPPARRRQSLPWQRPKDAAEDPDAPRRVQEILHSPTYREADQDTDFLHRDELRGVRLELDYLKPELALRAHDIRHTIVVFGGTRIVEPAAARRRVEEIRRAIETESGADRAATQRALRTAERILEYSRYYSVARDLGRLVSECDCGGADGRIVIMTGGGPGIMEAANRGAYDAGAKSIGLNITLPHEQYPNPYITPDLCFRFHYFALRKLHFLHRAKALVAFPGGYGTLDELFETLTLVQTRKIKPLPVILVGEEFWSRLIDFNFLVAEGLIDKEDEELFWFAETADQIWNDIVEWHRINGEPLLDASALQDRRP